MARAVRKLPAWQVVAALVIALYALSDSASDVVIPWHPLNTFGFTMDSRQVITRVTTGSSAARAGLRVGERIDDAQMRPEDRRQIGWSSGALPDTVATFAVATPRGIRRVTLRADTATAALDNDTAVLYALTVTGVIAIATALLFLRPSATTWAFYWYAVMSSGTGFLFGAALPFALFVGWASITTTAQALAWVPLTVFALRFARAGTHDRWRTAERMLYVLLAIGFAVGVYGWVGSIFKFPASDAVSNAFTLTQAVGFLVALAAFIVTYRGAAGADRARIRWVIVALVVGYFGTVWSSFALSFPILGTAVTVPIWLANIFSGLNVIVPVAVAYAILRHRVFDVRIVVSRALVFAVLTFCLVVAIALVDYAVGKIVSGTRLAAVAELAFAVAVGISLSATHKRLERFVENVLYRRRRRALLRLQRVGKSLIQAPNEAAVTRLIAAEPLEGFDLASAAVFRHAEGSGFVRVDGIGWDGMLERLDDGDSVVMQLRADPVPLRISEASWLGNAFHDADRAPAVALPVVVRSELEAVAFYGPHRSGEDLDSEEMAALSALLSQAAAAYDHLSAELARAELAMLHDQVRRLQDALHARR